MIAKRLLMAMAALAVMLLANTKVMAQDTKTTNDEVFAIVEVMPEFPGGMDSLMSFVAKNVNYPEEAQEKGISGRVMVKFVVEKDGSVNDVQVVRGVAPTIDAEAVRVVQAMPKWKPGMQKGEPVRVSYTLPLVFKAQ